MSLLARWAGRMAGGWCLAGAVGLAAAAKPTPQEALSLVPVQKEVSYDLPAPGEAARCVVEVETVGGLSGWVVRTEAGQVLRRFLDTNGDNKVDQWCYYKDGIEVYRDIDGDYNGKADQYRWLGTAGMRWGLDPNEDGRIDSWKVISAEEVTAELVAALRDRDPERFRRLLVSPQELASLGLGSRQMAELQERIAAASQQFATEAARQRVVTAKTEWLHFGASQPGVIPAGTEGSTKDLVVYDNVTAVVETEKKHGQLLVGTLVRVGEAWRLIDLPRSLQADGATPAVGYFFQASFAARPETDPLPPAASPVSPQVRQLAEELERLDKQLLAAKPAEQSKLHASRANLLERIIAAAPAADRALWIKQYAETVAAAVQVGTFPEGLTRLEQLLQGVGQEPEAAELVPFVKFRLLTAQYHLGFAQKEADLEQIHREHQQQLAAFVQDYPHSPDAAEAMLQLAISAELAGKTSEALDWFRRIASDFPESELKEKAIGAQRRLESVGKPLPLAGKTLDGRTLDLASLKGKVVLVHYWATWADPCLPDLTTIKALVAKYGSQGFFPVGVNLDGDPKQALDYVRQQRLAWPHLYEQGGLDSPLASQWGVLTLPTMLLIGKDGRVVHRNISAAELEAELKKLLPR